MSSNAKAPFRVVSVRMVPHKSVLWHYYRPAVYILKPRVSDGVETYRCLGSCGKPRSSKTAAERDGQAIASELGCEYRSGVRHGLQPGETPIRRPRGLRARWA